MMAPYLIYKTMSLMLVAFLFIEAFNTSLLLMMMMWSMLVMFL